MEVPFMRTRGFVHALIAAGAFALVAGVAWLDRTGRGAGILSHWEYWFRDNILTVRGRHNPPDSRLVFLGRDSDSMLDADDLQLYPDVPPEDFRALTLMTERNWSREVYALLCKRLLAGGARAVVLDIVFRQPDSGDAALQEVLRQFPDRIVLASDLVSGQHTKSWRLPSSILPDASPEHAAIGYDTLFPDSDGRIRRSLYQTTLEQLEGGIQPDEGSGSQPSSLALRAAAKLAAINLKRPFQPRLFRYTGPPGTFPAIPMYEVFAYWQTNCGNGAAFLDKVVIVGDSGSLMHDEAATPFGNMPGPEIHLNAINALLHYEFLRELPRWVDDLLIALAVTVAWLLAIRVKAAWLRFAAFFLLAAGYLWSVFLTYDHANTIVPAVPPVLAFGVAGLVSFVSDFTRQTLEKLRIRRTLEAYVSKDVVREVLDNPQSYLGKLGGQRQQVALIVTDLRDFTTMSEEMDSTQLVAQLNEYLSLMVDDIFSRRGSVDKFIGDAILAVWGHVKSEGAAQDTALAIDAALLMKESLRRLNTDWKRRGLRTFQMGCGVNFGEVIFGNIGSSRKMEPTVIGDAVNVTSRLEGLTKEYGRDLLVAEAAADLVGDAFRLQYVDKVTMKGKTKPLRIYSVVSRRDATLHPQMTAYLEAWERAQTAYAAGAVKEAKLMFEDCLQYWPDDSLLRIYIQRCTTLLTRPSEGVSRGVQVAEPR
jgi:adenylate cyclase